MFWNGFNFGVRSHLLEQNFVQAKCTLQQNFDHVQYTLKQNYVHAKRALKMPILLYVYLF